MTHEKLIGQCTACALLCLSLLLSGSNDEALQQTEARRLIAEALYQESGVGDYNAALAIYEEVVARGDELPSSLGAEAWMRMGLAQEVLGQTARAEDTYARLLESYSQSSWAADARSRLRSLEEDRKVVRKLPVFYSFDKDLGHREKAAS